MRVLLALVLLLGIGLAGLAAKTIHDRIVQYQTLLAEQQQQILPTTEIFVVTRQLNYGERLRMEDVRAIRWPAGNVPAGAFRNRDDIFPSDEDQLRTVLRTMERDEPLLQAKVSAPGEDAGVASRLVAGTRAFTLRVDVVAGVSGFLRPGDRVDVYWTGAGRNGTSVTRLIRSNVKIIAIDQISNEATSNPIIARTITIAAEPQDIAALTQAQSAGSLTLALVGLNEDENTITETVEVSMDSLLGPREQVVETAEHNASCQVRHRRGAEVVVLQVPCTQ